MEAAQTEGASTHHHHYYLKKVALILGVGGLGSIIMIDLLRLGIKRIYIVDYDVVDLHNINRQLLYTQ